MSLQAAVDAPRILEALAQAVGNRTGYSALFPLRGHMKNLKISRQLFALVGVLMAAFAVAIFFQIKSQEDSIYNERFDMLRTQVESGISILNQFYQREKSGEMTHEAAQAEAFKILTNVRFEPAGYIFGFDLNVIQLINPSPVTLRKDMSAQVD